jgi:transposase
MPRERIPMRKIKEVLRLKWSCGLSRRDVTLTLLWHEYKEQNPSGYQYSQFCELYKAYAKKVDLSMRQ